MHVSLLPALAVLCGLPPGRPSLACACRVAVQVEAMQQWQWAFFHAAHGDPAASAPEHLAVHFEALVFRWMQLSKAAGQVVALLGGTVPPEAGRWLAAAQQMDRALGLDGQPAVKPVLWKRGGRPLLPRTASLCSGYNALLALCAATTVGSEGFAADFRDQPAALAAAGIALELCGQQEHLPAADKQLVAAAAAAAVASDVALRAALLEGVCLFVYGSVVDRNSGAADQPSSAALEEIAVLLQKRVAQRANAAAAGALALLEYRTGEWCGTVNPSIVVGAEGIPPRPSLKASSDGPLKCLHGCLTAAQSSEESDGKAAGDPALALPAISPEVAPGDGLPAELMYHPSGRTMQLDLLGLRDLAMTARQLRLFSSAGLLSLLLPGSPSPFGPPPRSLQDQAALLVESGCRSIAEAAPLQQMAWLAELPEQGPQSGRQQQLVRMSLVHEAWFRWHQAMWHGSAARLPSSHLAAVPAAAQQQWAALAGPMRLHMASGTVLATALAADTGSAIGERAARAIQLRLAARQLRERCCEGSATEATVAAAEWRAAQLILAATLAAHLFTVPEGQRGQLEQAIDALAAAAEVDPAQQQPLLDAVAVAVSVSSHVVLCQLLRPVLLPALALLLGGGSGSPAGRAWALVGLLRLHLLVPPAGADPAAKYGLLQEHSLLRLQLQVNPELTVRQEVAALPGKTSLLYMRHLRDEPCLGTVALISWFCWC